MRDRRGDCDPALGLVLGTLGAVGIWAAIAAWGEAVLRYAAWAALVIRETMR